MKIWLFLASPFLVIFLAVATALSWDFNDTSGRRESLLANLSIERVALPLKQADFKGLKQGPFALRRRAASLSGKKNKRDGIEDLKVALIVISDKKSIAVVDGMVLTTGDFIKGLRVKRIEKDRVLFAGKKNIWRYLENR